jgi:hypothetical protein
MLLGHVMVGGVQSRTVTVAEFEELPQAAVMVTVT